MAFSLKDYQITEEIGRGGFATVYKARQKSLSREVAIKCLSPQRAQNEGEIVRFRREAEAMASLTHDNILAVFDYAFFGGNYYIVMEYVEGVSFETAIAGAVPRGAALSVLEKVAGALRYAHAEKIIHRDVKPANILLGRNGQIKLADFGLALFHTGIESYSSPVPVLGTISYMAPEALVSPRDVDARIDVFSLGCLLYRVCSGRAPFAGDSFGEISLHLLNDEPAPLFGGETTSELAALTMRCLQKDREKRPDVALIHEALKETLRNRYHAAHEDLVAFVRNVPQCSPSYERSEAAPPQVLPEIPPVSRKKNAASRLIAAMSAGIGLLATALLVGFHSMAVRPPSTAALPGLPHFQQNSLRSEAAGDALPEKNTLAPDGPSPLAGGALTMELAHLVVRGLMAEDTVYLNNKKEPPAAGNAGIELAPGHYRLVVQGRPGRRIVRELELLPYERQVVDLSNGAKRGKTNNERNQQ